MRVGMLPKRQKNASSNAAKGIFWSTVVSGVLRFCAVILFLFSSSDIDTLFSYSSPQPFVKLYAVAFGHGGHVFMNVLSVVALRLNTAIAMLLASSLPWPAMASSPFPNGFHASPKRVSHATPFSSFGSSAQLLHAQSTVAFTSLVPAAGVPSAAAYGLISLGRLFLADDSDQKVKPSWSLGRWSKPFHAIAVLCNGWVVAMLYSPYEFPVSAPTLNSAPVIMAIVAIFAVGSWAVRPASVWLPLARVTQSVCCPSINHTS